MLTYIRYVLATVCFATSVGCLALWWRSIENDCYHLGLVTSNGGRYHFLDTHVGYLLAFNASMTAQDSLVDGLRFGRSDHRDGSHMQLIVDKRGKFGWVHGPYHTAYYCPLWYPALIFALAGVGVLRFRRQFSIRSALLATTVIAALIAMAVAL